ncbi:hypothetical protein CO046_03140 [Candidatus Peregrinibacteria bacterium CG_4_9_14_0_2_um_filter_53_11]|nr:MAG: hypothetical protein CO046_03140 [Candidatus Peregrinibacteria bacterium CG_4_9_14_0_2_um_filter_53_11]
MKKLIALATGLLFFVNGALTTLAQFEDVTSTTLYREDIQYLWDSGIVTGTLFDPLHSISREDYAEWILRNAGFSPLDYTPQTEERFDDVSMKLDPQAPFVYRLVDLGIITIGESKKFRPNRALYKAEALDWLFQLEGIPVPKIFEEDSFQATDLKTKDKLAPIVNKSIELGLLEPGKVWIKRRLTRAQAAHFLHQVKSRTGVLTITVAPTVNSELISEPQFNTFAAAWNSITRDYLHKDKVNKKDLIYAAIEGMVRELGDKHTTFERPGDPSVADSLSGQVEGIGVIIQDQEGEIVVVTPLEGSPAFKAGLKPHDVFTNIDGKPLDGLSLTDVARLIKGERGTSVKITVKRGALLKSFTIKREVIIVHSVTERRTDDNYSIIKINNFAQNTNEEFAKIVAGMETNAPKGIVLDLRNNPGGFLTTAVDLASYFVLNGDLVTTIRYPNRNEPLAANGAAQLHDTKVVVLINAGSASASEILAGALRDYNLAKIVGETSYGKGTVQELDQYYDGSTLKLTIAEWLTPNGVSIDGKGIVPDVLVPLSDEERFDDSADRQLQEALNQLR